MKENKTTELILNLSGLPEGIVRAAVSSAVQERLFACGYAWSVKNKTVQTWPIVALHVQRPDRDLTEIAYASGEPCPFHNDGNVKFFGFGQVEDFLAAAKKATSELKTVIEGVDVTITFDKVDLDATALLARVNAKARELKSERFGSDSGC